MNKKQPIKKKPADYPILRVRVPAEKDLERLRKQVKEIRTRMNKGRGPDQKVLMGNHVILEALEIGLKELSRGKIR